MWRALLQKMRLRRWRKRYRPGRAISQFVACDIRRDVEVVDGSRIAEGVISARTRTWNVLYTVKGLSPQPPFGPVREIAIRELWDWPGQDWGGPVPDDVDEGG